MKEYFKSAGVSPADRIESAISERGLMLEQNLPVQPTKVEWTIEEKPERFVRRFQFDDRRRLIDFINEILQMEDQMKHHGELRISYNVVDISVYTHNLEKITELDQEYIHEIDKIHQDVMHYGYEANNY